MILMPGRFYALFGGAASARASRAAGAPDEHAAVAFDPPRTGATRDAIAHIAKGPVVKVMLGFQTLGSETLGNRACRDDAFLRGDDTFRTSWTQSPVCAKSVVAWARDPAADSFIRYSDEELKAVARASAGLYFNAGAAAEGAFSCAYANDWLSDPIALGAYSFTIGAERELVAVLLDGALWFAGEASTAEGERESVAGAPHA